MSTGRKWHIWLAGVAGGFLLLILIFLLVLPSALHLNFVKEKIKNTASEHLAVTIDYDRLKLSFLPRPRIVFYRVTLTKPGQTLITFNSAAAELSVLSLLRGEFGIADVRIESPRIKFELTEGPSGQKTPIIYKEALNEAATVANELTSKLPDLTVEVKDGLAEIYRVDRPVFKVETLRMKIRCQPDRLRLDLVCRSNLWQNLSLQAEMDPGLKVDCRMLLKALKPQTLPTGLLPSTLQQMADVDLDLTLRLEGGDPDTLTGTFQGSLPSVQLVNPSRTRILEGLQLNGDFHFNDREIKVSLVNLDIAYPRLKVKGDLLIDQTSPEINLTVEGTDLEGAEIREVAMAVGGEIPRVREICGYVGGGKIASVTLHSQGRSFGDIVKPENFSVKGRLTGGKIIHPGLGLVVDKAAGEISFSHGTLQGRNLEARLGHSRIYGGALALETVGDTRPFHLDVHMEANLGEAQKILTPVLKDTSAGKELAMVHDLEGMVSIRLILGGTMESITIGLVDLTEVALSCRYERAPYPIHIEKGHITYTGDGIEVKDLRGKLGESSFSQINGLINLGKVPYLQHASGDFTASAQEVYGWLTSFEMLREGMKDIKKVKGTAELKLRDLSGPLEDPGKWRFTANCDLQQLFVETSLLPAPITILKGSLKATRESILISESTVGFMDTTCIIRGSLDDYLGGLRKVQAMMNATIGPEADEWMAEQIQFPSDFRLRTPYSLSQVVVQWEKEKDIMLRGTLMSPRNQHLTADLVLGRGEVLLNNLIIEDSISQASFGFKILGEQVYVRFKGGLAKSFLDGLLVENRILTGTVEGDIEADLHLDQPIHSTARGMLRTHGLKLTVPLPSSPATRVILEDISLRTTGNRILIEPAAISWDGKRFVLTGETLFSSAGFVLDMDVLAEELQWEKIQSTLDDIKKAEPASTERTNKQEDRGENLPIRGSIRIKADAFSYGAFTWRPVEAEIMLGDGEISLMLKQADICGISTLGTIKLTPPEIAVDSEILSRENRIENVLSCLQIQFEGVGEFDLKAKLNGKGQPEDMIRSLQGSFELNARDGRITKDKIFSGILAFLNTTEILRGKIPPYDQEGFPFNTIKAQGELLDGTLNLKEIIIDGKSMNVYAVGEIDIIDKKIDTKILVSPLKTVESIFSKIPLLPYILGGGSITAIPVRVRGPLNNPLVVPLSPSVLGENLLGIMGRTLALPLNAIKFILPKQKQETE